MGFKLCVLAVVAKTFVWRWAASIMVNSLHVFRHKYNVVWLEWLYTFGQL